MNILESDKKKGISSQGIIVPFITFSLIGISCLLIFSLVRSYFRDIYSPRRGLDRCRPPRIKKGIFSWLPAIFKIPESFLISTVGLDGVMLLRFFKMSMKLFMVLSVLGLAILAPVNYNAHEDDQGDDRSKGGFLDENKLLRRITVENIPQGSPFLKFHLAYLWLASFIAYAFLIAYYRDYVSLKFQYQEHVLRKSKMSKIDLRSVMVYGIPRELRFEADLAAYYEGLGLGKIESVVICRKWSKLQKAVEKRAYYLIQLENVYGKVMKIIQNKRSSQNVFLFYRGSNESVSRFNELNVDDSLNSTNFSRIRFSAQDSSDGSITEIISRLDSIDPKYRPTHRIGFLGIFGLRVDSAEYFAQQFKIYDKQTEDLRRETSPPTSVGFVTFESPESAILASQVNLASRPFACMTRAAPEPRDLYWPNLSSATADTYMKLIRSIFVMALMFFMVFFNTIVVTAISSLFDLESIAKIIPALAEIINNMDQFTKQFIQGVVPTAVLSLWTSTLPSLLLILSQMQGLEARSWIEMSVMSKYFFYQLWNILFVVVVSSTVYKGVMEIQTPRDVLELLANSLPQASPTLINYTMLQALALYPAQLLLVGPVVLTWIYRISPWSRGTNSPRQTSDAYYPSTLTSINYGIAYPIPILLWVIGIVYTPIAPIICVFCSIFFAVAYVVFKYMLLYVHIPQYETGGMHAPMAVKRCLVGMLVMQTTMMGVLALKATPAKESHKLESLNETSNVLADGSTELTLTSYLSYVLLVLPLLFMTAGVHWWFKNGYEQQIKHLPLDILGKVGREITRLSEDDLTPKQNVLNPREIGEELCPVSSLQSKFQTNRSSSSKTLTKKTSARTLERMQTYRGTIKEQDRTLRSRESTESLARGGFETTVDVIGQPPTTAEEGEPSSFETRQRAQAASLISLFSPSSSPNKNRDTILFDETDENEFSIPDDNEDASSLIFTNSRQATQSNDNIQNRQLPIGLLNSHCEGILKKKLKSLGIDDVVTSKAMHLEPPMTRVYGVLDPPLDSSIPIIPDMDEEEFNNNNTLSSLPNLYATPAISHLDVDLTLYTYLHPALIGRLPVAWLATSERDGVKDQPRLLQEARDEQKKRQADLRRRVIGRQRLGMVVVENDEEEAEGEGESLLNRRRTLGRGGVGFKVYSVFDQISSWAHLALS